MGQKSNPIILRLGNKKKWNSKYLGEKHNETSLLTLKDFEIRRFAQKFLKDHGLNLQECLINYYASSIHLILSYYLTSQSIYFIDKINKNQKIKLNLQKKNKKKVRKKIFILKNKTNKSFIYENRQKLNLLKNNKKIKQLNLNIIAKKQATRIKNLKLYKRYLEAKTFKNFKNIKLNRFLTKFCEILKKSIPNKNIRITFKQINNHNKTFKLDKLKHLQNKLTHLRKYKNNNFFKEGINIIYMALTKKKCADLLNQYITFQLKKFKRHNFFLKFVVTALKMFVKTKFSLIKGIKIKVTGRINGIPRAKSKNYLIGNVPIFSLKSNIDYAEGTAFTSNGTLGIKIWTCEK